MNLSNMDIRETIQKKRLRYYEVAKALDVTPFTLSRWLCTELSPEKHDRIMKAIDSITV